MIINQSIKAIGPWCFSDTAVHQTIETPTIVQIVTIKDGMVTDAFEPGAVPYFLVTFHKTGNKKDNIIITNCEVYYTIMPRGVLTTGPAYAAGPIFLSKVDLEQIKRGIAGFSA